MALQVNDWIWLRLSSRYGVSPAEAQLGDVFKRWLDERGGTWGYDLVDFYASKNVAGTTFTDGAYNYWSGGALQDATFWIDAFSASRNEPWATNLGSGGFALRARYGVTNSAAIKDSSLYLPGIVGNYASTPDSPALDITGDLELVMRLSLDDWTPSPLNKYSFSKRATGGNQRSWLVEHVTNGAVRLYWSTDGITDLSALSTANLSALADGQVVWLKITFDVDNGAGGNDVKFWWASDQADEPTSWTQLGATVTTAGVTSIFNSTARVQMGGWEDGGTDFGGRFYRAIVRNGIGGTTVFDANFVTAPEGAVTFVESTGKTVTVVAVADSNDPVLLTHTGTNYLYLPGVSGNNVSAPSITAYNINGDLEIELDIALVTLSPTTNSYILARGVSDPNRAFFLSLQTTGAPRLTWYPTGSVASAVSAISTATLASVGISAGQRFGLKVTLDVDNGGSGNDVLFWYSTNNGLSWTQLGSTITNSGVTSLPTVTASMNINPNLGGTELAASVYRCIVRNGIGGTTVFDADFTTGITSGSQTTFTESSVNAATVTINRSSSGRKSVAVVRPVWLFGTDDYMEVAADPYGAYVRTTNATAGNITTTHTTYDTGTATAGASTTLDDTAKAWTASAYVSRVVRITGGTGVGQVRVITANTATQLTVTPAWTTIPDATSTYVIESRGNVTDDIQIVVRCALDNWATGANQPLVAKRTTGQWSYYFVVTATGALGFSYTLDGSTAVSLGSAVAPFTNGTAYWIRFRRTASTGAYSFEYAADQATEPTVWTTLSSSTGATGVMWQGTADVNIGGATTLAFTNGKFYYVRVNDGFAGATIVEWAAYGHAASGGSHVDARNTVWVAGSLATVVNANPLNFGSTDSFTVVAIVRQWATPISFGRYVDKKLGGGAFSGWSFSSVGTTQAGGIYIGDGTTGLTAATSTPTAGSLTCFTSVVDRTAQTATAFVNNTAGTPTSITTAGSLGSPTPVRIGAAAPFSGASSYQDFELLAVAVVPKALTTDEIAKIVAAYQ